MPETLSPVEALPIIDSQTGSPGCETHLPGDPSATVSRVAEWALGNEITVPPHASDVSFTAGGLRK